MTNIFQTLQAAFSLQALTQILAVLLTGLIAGLFYGYDCSVTIGLGQLTDQEYLQAFQSINTKILNPYFFISFIGSLIVLPLATWLPYQHGHSPSYYFLLSSTLVYTLGVFVMTLFGNVLLNQLLENIDLASLSKEALYALRLKFENPWNTFHHLRTYSAILAFLLTILSVFNRS